MGNTNEYQLEASNMSNNKNVTSMRRKRKAKQITYSEYFNPNGMLLKIQQKGELGSYRGILFSIHDQLLNLLSHHSKIYVMRFDFHVNPDKWEEGMFSELLKKTLPKLKRYYKVKHIAYTWGREIGKNGLPHFHLMIAISGHEVNFSKTTHEFLLSAWSSLEQGGIHRSDGHMLSNSVDQHFVDAFHHMSYIAKVFTKDEQPKNIRSYGCSNIKQSEKRKFSSQAA